MKLNRVGTAVISVLATCAFFALLPRITNFVHVHVGPHDEFISGLSAKPAAKGHVVAFIDTSTISLPLQLVLDDNQTRSMRAVGMFSIVPIQDTEAMQKHGYDKLLTDRIHGAPGLAIFDEADHDRLVYAAACPTDKKARDKIFKKLITNLPPPLNDAAESVVLSNGQPSAPRVDENGLEFVDVGGHRRFLTARTDPIKLGALKDFSEDNPTISEAQWFPVNRRNVFDRSTIKDQDAISSCAANAGASAEERTRWYYGMKPVALSPGFLYALVNGGQDQGAVISDVIPALTKRGTCADSIINQKPFMWSTIKNNSEAIKNATRYKIIAAYHCRTWDQCGSAVIAGYGLEYGIQAGRNWTTFNNEGVTGHDPGPGNHAIGADGIAILKSGEKVLDGYTSWGADYGPWKNGRFYQDKKHLFGGGNQADAIAIKVVVCDPEEPYALPTYKPAQ